MYYNAANRVRFHDKSNTGAHEFSKNEGQTQNFWRQKRDVKQFHSGETQTLASRLQMFSSRRPGGR